MEAANLSDVPKKMEAAKQTHLPPPLVSRLDHLDFSVSFSQSLPPDFGHLYSPLWFMVVSL
uniref:Uncharacterized protein n=1 Tax=Rhizophora mucronata TaxID=61149 RepID=A0A2P2IKX2_RHIMU